MTKKTYLGATIVAIILAFIGSVFGIVASQGAILPLWLKSTWIVIDLVLFVFILVKAISYIHQALTANESSEDQVAIAGTGFVGGIIYLIFIGICFSQSGYAALSYVFLVLLCLACYVDVHWARLLQQKQDSPNSEKEEVA